MRQVSFDPYEELRARVAAFQAGRVVEPPEARRPDASDPVVCEALARFYRDVVRALGQHVNGEPGGGRKAPTAQGFGIVLKRLALQQGLPVEHVPLPRLSRSRFEAQEPW